MCGEAYVLPLSFMALWVRPDEFHQTFNFRYLDALWNSESIFKTVNESFEAFDSVGAPSTWVLSNHDVIRHASRLGGDYGRATASDGIGPNAPQPDLELGLKKARAATLFTLGLPGSMYLYQGEELGLPEHTDLQDEYRQDPTFFRTNGVRVGRDGCRVPLPWEAGVNQANGFSSTGEAWLPQPDIYRNYSRDLQEGTPGSTLEMYKAALRIRSELDLGQGSFEWVQELCNEDVLAFRNTDVFVIHNFGSEPIAAPSSELLISSSNESSTQILPNETRWLRVA
jgi:alpha-glucosidase